jgi:hypothetical protein
MPAEIVVGGLFLGVHGRSQSLEPTHFDLGEHLT